MRNTTRRSQYGVVTAIFARRVGRGYAQQLAELNNKQLVVRRAQRGAAGSGFQPGDKGRDGGGVYGGRSDNADAEPAKRRQAKA